MVNARTLCAFVRAPDVQTSAMSSVFTLFTVIKCARSPELIFVRLFGSPVNNLSAALTRGFAIGCTAQVLCTLRL